MQKRIRDSSSKDSFKTKPQTLKTYIQVTKNNNISVFWPLHTSSPFHVCFYSLSAEPSNPVHCRVQEKLGSLVRISRCSPGTLCACRITTHTTHPLHPGPSAFSDSSGSSWWTVGSWVSLSARTTYLGKTHGGSAASPLAPCLALSAEHPKGKASFLWWEDEWTRWECIKGGGVFSGSFPELSAWVAVLG